MQSLVKCEYYTLMDLRGSVQSQEWIAHMKQLEPDVVVPPISDSSGETVGTEVCHPTKGNLHGGGEEPYFKSVIKLSGLRRVHRIGRIVTKKSKGQMLNEGSTERS